MKHVTILAFDEGHSSTVLAPMEIFQAAGCLWNALQQEKIAPEFEVTVVSVDGKPIFSSGGLKLTPACAMQDIRKTDLVFVSTVGLDYPTAPKRFPQVMPWLQDWQKKGVMIAGVCTGVTMLAEAGLLDGKPATTHWGLQEYCDQHYPEVDWQFDKLVTESDGIFTGGAVYAAIDLSLYIMSRLVGEELTRKSAKALLMEQPRIWQSGFAAPPTVVDHDDDRVHKAEQILLKSFREPVSFETLADELNMSPRNFNRRFKQATGLAPREYLHRLRIGEAKSLFETGNLTVTAISQAVGYDDLSFFRSLFKRHTGMSPQEYKRRFGMMPGLA